MEYSGEKVKLLIGAEISPRFSDVANDLQQNLEEASWLSWTKSENLHLTVFFLGDVRIEMLENVISLFRLGYQSCHPLTFTDGMWAWAPVAKDPRMIWIRFPKSEEFSKLVRSSQNWFSQIQPAPQQRMRPRPHITVARFRPEEKRSINLPAGQIDGTLRIKSLKLWRSDVNDDGVNYTPLATFRLGRK